MSTAFAAAEARLGASVLKCLGNASITLADASVVDGMLRNNGREAYVGTGMQARDIEFECAASAVTGLVEGATVSLTYRGATTSHVVSERMPDDVHLRNAIIVLRRAS